MVQSEIFLKSDSKQRLFFVRILCLDDYYFTGLRKEVTAKRIKDRSIVSSTEPRFDDKFFLFVCFVQIRNVKLFLF